MDKPIEKRALGVDARVERALAAGVYAIDADDARELLAALRHSQHVSRGFDYQNMELTTQVRALKEHAQELEVALDASQGQVRQLEAEAAALRDQVSAQAELLKVWIPVGGQEMAAHARLPLHGGAA